jgi:hypothetical protein
MARSTAQNPVLVDKQARNPESKKYVQKSRIAFGVFLKSSPATRCFRKDLVVEEDQSAALRRVRGPAKADDGPRIDQSCDEATARKVFTDMVRL